jgi:hypothetical protein
MTLREPRSADVCAEDGQSLHPLIVEFNALTKHPRHLGCYTKADLTSKRMRLSPKKSPHRQLRIALTIFKVLGMIGVIVSALQLSATGVVAGLILLVIAAISEIIVDLAERLGQSRSILDALPILTEIQQILTDMREVQVLQSKDPQVVLRYSELKYSCIGFPEGEEIIATNAAASFGYAANILRAPFPKGEAAIAQNGNLACKYALEVLKGRFPLWEPAINQDLEAKKKYEGDLKADAG